MIAMTALSLFADASVDAAFWFGFCLGFLAMAAVMMIATGLGLPRDRSAGGVPE